jgi:hypothetical protein
MGYLQSVIGTRLSTAFNPFSAITYILLLCPYAFLLCLNNFQQDATDLYRTLGPANRIAVALVKQILVLFTNS